MAPEVLQRLEQVLERLSAFGLQLKAKKCTFMQTEVSFLSHIVGQAGLACDPGKVSAMWAWHAPGSVNQVRQFVGFIGYYRRFIQNFAGLSEPLSDPSWPPCPPIRRLPPSRRPVQPVDECSRPDRG